MRTVTLTDQERDSGQMPEDKRDQAIAALQEEGFVGLVNAIRHDILGAVYDGMITDLDWVERHFGPLPKRGPDGWGGRNCLNGFGPPRRRECLFHEVLFNPFAIAVTHGMMGDQSMRVHFANYDANWSFPLNGAEPKRQGVHGDTGPLFPSLSVPEPAFMMNLIIPLQDFTEENGATEIWPTTHLNKPQISDAADKDHRQRMLDEQREQRPPERMIAPKGTVVLRDPRGWHAGMPNHTDQCRIMIAMRHCPDWMRISRKNPNTGIKEPMSVAYEPEAEDFFREANPWLMHHTAFEEGADRNRLLREVQRSCPDYCE